MSTEGEIQDNLKDSEDFENDSNSNSVTSPTWVLGRPGIGKTIPYFGYANKMIDDVSSSPKPRLVHPLGSISSPNRELPHVDPSIFSQSVWWLDENRNLTRLSTMEYQDILDLKDYLDLNVADLFKVFLWRDGNNLDRSDLVISILKIMDSKNASTNDAVEWLEETQLYVRVLELIAKHEENGAE